VIGVICPWEKKERRKREILFFSFFLQKAREEEGKAKNAGKPSGSFACKPHAVKTRAYWRQVLARSAALEVFGSR